MAKKKAKRKKIIKKSKTKKVNTQNKHIFFLSDLIGRTKEKAIEMIEKAGFTVNIKYIKRKRILDSNTLNKLRTTQNPIITITVFEGIVYWSK